MPTLSCADAANDANTAPDGALGDARVASTDLSCAPGDMSVIDKVAGKKVYIKTFGCQMNVYDSERMTEALVADGCA